MGCSCSENNVEPINHQKEKILFKKRSQFIKQKTQPKRIPFLSDIESINSSHLTSSQFKHNKRSTSLSSYKEQYQSGLVLSGNITEVFDPTLSKVSCIKMMKNALCDTIEHSIKLNQNQITLIGSLVYESIQDDKGGNDVPKLPNEHIMHPMLNNVLVKISVKKLTKDLIKKEKCFKGKNISDDEIKKEFSNNNSHKNQLKVLSIEIK